MFMTEEKLLRNFTLFIFLCFSKSSSNKLCYYTHTMFHSVLLSQLKPELLLTLILFLPWRVFVKDTFKTIITIIIQRTLFSNHNDNIFLFFQAEEVLRKYQHNLWKKMYYLNSNKGWEGRLSLSLWIKKSTLFHQVFKVFWSDLYGAEKRI